MRTLAITWQRFVDANKKTCDRCGLTRINLGRAVKKLDQLLESSDIKTKLEEREIDLKAFSNNPSESNKIWIADKPIEYWLEANVASSQCCSFCGESQCRTLEVGNEVFETIPEELIIKAGLKAASGMKLSSVSSKANSGTPNCCS